jgi:sRNA-binding protein
VSYWVLLMSGTPRIDLDGNVAGEVTIEDEQNAQRKIAKAARRAKAKEIEASKAAESPRRLASPRSNQSRKPRRNVNRRSGLRLRKLRNRPNRPLTSHPPGRRRRRQPMGPLASAWPG